MNLLIVGGGKAGSWAIRGEQIGAALGARVTSEPQRADFDWADVILIVKRAIYQFGAAAKASGKPLVWDVLDFWRQPDENGCDIAFMVTRVQQLAAQYGAELIAATQAMADAIGGVYIPHHYRPGTVAQPVREQIQTVAYEGCSLYLGSWEGVLKAACAERGWSFVINPTKLQDADLIVALRGEQWDGELCRKWKSGVKLVNAIACGRPVICQHSAAQREIGGGALETAEQLNDSLDFWDDNTEIRMDLPDFLAETASSFSIDAIADRYRKVLEGVLCPA